MTLDTGHKYEVFIDGVTAPPEALFEAAPGGAITITTDPDGIRRATPHTTGTVHLGTELNGRGGAVDVEVVDAPLAITFGPAEAL